MDVHLKILFLFLVGHTSAVNVVPGDTIFPGEGGCRDSTYNKCVDGGDLGAICTPLGDGSHTCTCSPGYELYSDGICKMSPDPCASSFWDNGNYICSAFGDVPGTCSPNTASKVGYTCVCPAGSYSGSSPYGGCFSDPCAGSPCNGGTCTPQNGDSSSNGYPYTCTGCPSGTIFFGGTCQDPCALSPCPTKCSVNVNRATGFECSCSAGQVFFGFECLDPCAVNITGNTGYTFCSKIDAGATCYPSAATPSYEECACSAGYTSVYDPAAELKTCVDVDECKTVPGACGVDPSAVCTNTVGSYACTCSTGYKNDTGICTDIDECATVPNACRDPLATCTNTVGSFICTCPTGYVYSGGVCADINECTTTFQPCGSDLKVICVNTVGSFSCSCLSGYKFVNQTCVPPGLCNSILSPCGEADPNAVCVDTPGSYTCTCSPGFLFTLGKCLPQPICYDKKKDCKGKGKKGDKCKRIKHSGKGDNSGESNDNSGENGKSNCTCSPGYIYLDGACQDINECLLSIDPCRKNCKSGTVNTCQNTIGGFICTCRYGGFCDDGKRGNITKIKKSKKNRCDCKKSGRGWWYYY